MNDNETKKFAILREHQRKEREALTEKMKIYSKEVKESFKPKQSTEQAYEH